MLAGEERARQVWRGDLYGAGEVAAIKRRGRGGMGWPYVWPLLGEGGMGGFRKGRDGDGEVGGWVREFLQWGGGETGKEVYAGWLPWDLEGRGRGWGVGGEM